MDFDISKMTFNIPVVSNGIILLYRHVCAMLSINIVPFREGAWEFHIMIK